MGQLRESEGCQGGRKALGRWWQVTRTPHGAVAGLDTDLEATWALLMLMLEIIAGECGAAAFAGLWSDYCPHSAPAGLCWSPELLNPLQSALEYGLWEMLHPIHIPRWKRTCLRKVSFNYFQVFDILQQKLRWSMTSETSEWEMMVMLHWDEADTQPGWKLSENEVN